MTRSFGKPRCKNCGKPFTPFRHFKYVCGTDCAVDLAYKSLQNDSVSRETKDGNHAV